METFLEKHSTNITGVLSCYDRILFKGYLQLSRADEAERFLDRNGVLLKNFKDFAPTLAKELSAHAKAWAEERRRPYQHLMRKSDDKDAIARAIMARDNVAHGLVCVLSAVEGCQSYRIIPAESRPRLKLTPRKCLCLYYYFNDREFGFLHVRIQTWLPFTMQVYINGHDWLAKKMTASHMDYTQKENAFLRIADVTRAQRLADRLQHKAWPPVLDAFATQVNPLLKTRLQPYSYYWCAEQIEYSTDIMFTSEATLEPLYQQLQKHAVLHLSAEDVLSYFGKSSRGALSGQVVSSYKETARGTRIKHWYKGNWIKMYDKHGSVLRIETVVNRPAEFKVLRMGKRGDTVKLGWYPLPKGVAYFNRFAEVGLAANRRYLNALAAVTDPAPALAEIRHLGATLTHNNRGYRGFNPAAVDDAALFRATMRGEFLTNGFRNRDIRNKLLSPADTPEEQRRQSAKISRLLKRMHLHTYLAKFPRSRRWRVTAKGWNIMSAALSFHDHDAPIPLQETGT